MDRAFLENLGLTVTENDGAVEAKLELSSGQAFNPLNRRAIDSVSFTVVADRLVYKAPPELAGAQPINIAVLNDTTRVEELVVQQLNDHLFQLERRSRELSALGVSAEVDPATLRLSATLEHGPFQFVIGANRAGQFLVAKASKGGRALPMRGSPTAFELSEFRERGALVEFLQAMFSEIADLSAPLAASAPEALPGARPISFQEISSAFGGACLPPRSALELVCDLLVHGDRLRFAAARVEGRTFRGLLAGPSGKLWAERFELDEFQGVRALVAKVLEVSIDEVEVVP